MSSADLRLEFQRVPGATSLELGRTLMPGAAITADITLPDIAVDALFGEIPLLDADITLPDVVADADMAYLVNVWRGPQCSTRAPHAEAANRRADVSAPWDGVSVMTAAHRARWSRLERRAPVVAARWEDMERMRAATTAPWSDLERRFAGPAVRWSSPPRRRRDDVLRWADATPRRTETASAYFDPPRKQADCRPAWHTSNPRRLDRPLPWRGRPARRKFDWRIPWEDGNPVISLWPRPDRWTPPPPLPRTPSPHLVLACLRADGQPTHLYIGRACQPMPPAAVTIPIRRVYIVIHDIEVLRLPDNYPIQAANLAIDLDADAWAWGWRATLLGKDALDAVQPDSNGEPVTLAVRIDGHLWHLLAEEWSETREFGKRAINVSGRSLTARLGAPWHLPGNGVTTTTLTAQQLMAAHLPLGSGWALAFAPGTPDWLVPSGAWGWQNQTPIAAIHAAATGHGLIVSPPMTGQTLIIRPRYPVLPWHYATTPPDLVVPDAAILALTRRKAIETQANAIYVHGGTPGGILAHVKRTGSAADRAAPTQSGPLITHPDAARLLGSRALAAQHAQPEIKSLTLPLGGPFALGRIGQLLRVNLAGQPIHGTINAVAIEATLTDTSTSVRQTLTLGEDTPNVWSKFRTLLPDDPLLYGTILHAHADQTATIELLGGGLQRVRGGGTVGNKVFIRAGQIDGPAPVFSTTEIIVV